MINQIAPVKSEQEMSALPKISKKYRLSEEFYPEKSKLKAKRTNVADSKDWKGDIFRIYRASRDKLGYDSEAVFDFYRNLVYAKPGKDLSTRLAEAHKTFESNAVKYKIEELEFINQMIERASKPKTGDRYLLKTKIDNPELISKSEKLAEDYQYLANIPFFYKPYSLTELIEGRERREIHMRALNEFKLNRHNQLPAKKEVLLLPEGKKTLLLGPGTIESKSEGLFRLIGKIIDKFGAKAYDLTKTRVKAFKEDLEQEIREIRENIHYIGISDEQAILEQLYVRGESRANITLKNKINRIGQKVIPYVIFGTLAIEGLYFASSFLSKIKPGIQHQTKQQTQMTLRRH